jgi:hypothetical protein
MPTALELTGGAHEPSDKRSGCLTGPDRPSQMSMRRRASAIDRTCCAESASPRCATSPANCSCSAVRRRHSTRGSRSICPDGPRGSSPAARRVRGLPLRRARAGRQGCRRSNAQRVLRRAPRTALAVVLTASHLGEAARQQTPGCGPKTTTAYPEARTSVTEYSRVRIRAVRQLSEQSCTQRIFRHFPIAPDQGELWRSRVHRPAPADLRVGGRPTWGAGQRELVDPAADAGVVLPESRRDSAPTASPPGLG